VSEFRRTPPSRTGAARPTTRPATPGDAVDGVLRSRSASSISSPQKSHRSRLKVSSDRYPASFAAVGTQTRSSPSTPDPDGRPCSRDRLCRQPVARQGVSLASRSTHPTGRPAERKAPAPIGSSAGVALRAAAGHGPKDGRTLGPTALGAGVLAWQVCRIAQRRGGASSERRAQAASDLAPADRPARRGDAHGHPARPPGGPPLTGAPRFPRSVGRRPSQSRRAATATASPARPRPQITDRPAERYLPTVYPRPRSTEPPPWAAVPGRPARHATRSTHIVCILHEGAVINDVLPLTRCLPRAPRIAALGHMARP
jgi:hypothetical protein